MFIFIRRVHNKKIHYFYSAKHIIKHPSQNKYNNVVFILCHGVIKSATNERIRLRIGL